MFDCGRLQSAEQSLAFFALLAVFSGFALSVSLDSLENHLRCFRTIPTLSALRLTLLLEIRNPYGDAHAEKLAERDDALDSAPRGRPSQMRQFVFDVFSHYQMVVKGLSIDAVLPQRLLENLICVDVLVHPVANFVSESTTAKMRQIDAFKRF